MIFPADLRLGTLTLHPHPVFEMLAYIVGFSAYLRERRRTGDVVATRERVFVVAAAVFGGIVGSRLLFLVEDPWQTMTRLHETAFLLGGKSIVGALVGGVIAVEWVKTHLGVVVATGDLLALPL